jgi:hypothetical protein
MRWKRRRGVGAMCAAAAVAVAAAALGQPSHGSPPQGPTAEPTGETQEILQRAKDYRSWQKFPRYAKEAAFSKGHGKTYVVAWYNEAAAAAVKAGGGTYPDGSILVKENRPEPDASPAALTVMAKRGGGWYWIRATPDGKVFTREGKPIAGPDVAACAGCHSVAEGDMVFSR